jgi:hypothetical protein
MLHSVSELDIQRCVDGELSDDDRSQFLTRLEESESGWRELALAFVENQVIAQACRDVCRPAQVLKPAAMPMVSRPKQTKASRFTPPAWSVTVAAALVGVAFGLLAGNRPARDTSTHDNSPEFADSQTDAHQHDSLDQGLDEAIPQPVMNMEFADASGDASHWTLPVYDADEVGQEYWLGHDVFPEEVRQELSRRGYRLDHDREFYSIPLDDGREVAVPVDTVQVRYNGL